MKLTILNGFTIASTIPKNFAAQAEAFGLESEVFPLTEMNIKPCRSCGSCGFKTPGKCILKDDMEPIFRALARCDVFAFLTPIRYGGFSSHLKKAVDRLMFNLTPFYYVNKEGHLLHPMRYGKKQIIGIGMLEKEQAGAMENFQRLLANNALNMQYPHHTLVLRADEDGTRQMAELLKEVLNNAE